jgi:hypothetical protein
MMMDEDGIGGRGVQTKQDIVKNTDNFAYNEGWGK